MKNGKNNKKIILSLLVIIASVVSFTGILNMVNAQNSNTIISYSVTGSPNYNAPGTESFWNNIPWTSVQLIQSENGGGHTPEISVKSAHTSNEIYVLVTWNDSHPSYVGSSAFGFNSVAILEGKGSHGTYYINGPNRTQEAMAVDNGTLIGLYHNSTFYYPDRAAMMWSLGATSDCMNLGVNGGSLSTGAANIWEWEFGSTDNSSKDPAWNMWKNTTATGTNAVPTHSFALNLYTNQSNLYQVGIGGNTTANWYNPVPGTVNVDPFNVWTAATYANGNWTVEFVRNFTTPTQISNYEVQITPGKSYNVAFAVWQGYQGESAFVKSISPSFVTLTISSAAPPSSTTTSSSASMPSIPLLLVGVIVVVIIVGAVVVVYIYRNPKDKK